MRLERGDVILLLVLITMLGSLKRYGKFVEWV